MFLQTMYCMYILLCYKLKFIVSLISKKNIFKQFGREGGYKSHIYA